MNYITTPLHSAAAAAADGETLDVSFAQTVAIHFVNTGTPSGTVTFEGNNDGTNWIAVPVEKADGTLTTTTTAAGYFRLPLNHGLKQFRARISTYASGAFTIIAGKRFAQ